MYPAIIDFDLFWLYEVNLHMRSDLLNSFVPLFSSTPFLWLITGVFLGVRIHSWYGGLGNSALKTFAAAAALIILASGLSDLTCNVIKKNTGRIRPLNALPLVSSLDDGKWRQNPSDFKPSETRGNSFPSAHAANSMSAALIAVAVFPRVSPLLLILPLLVGFSRVYLGKHFPTDVLSGYLLGGIIALLAFLIVCTLGKHPFFARFFDISPGPCRR